MTFEYIERGGLLFPRIEVDDPQKLAELGKYGLQRLNYLKMRKPSFFTELVRTSKLAEHCEEIEEAALCLSEQIRENYIAKHPLPEDDFWERVAIRMMAQMVAEKMVCFQIIQQQESGWAL